MKKVIVSVGMLVLTVLTASCGSNPSNSNKRYFRAIYNEGSKETLVLARIGEVGAKIPEGQTLQIGDQKLEMVDSSKGGPSNSKAFESFAEVGPFENGIYYRLALKNQALAEKVVIEVVTQKGAGEKIAIPMAQKLDGSYDFVTDTIKWTGPENSKEEKVSLLLKGDGLRVGLLDPKQKSGEILELKNLKDRNGNSLDEYTSAAFIRTRKGHLQNANDLYRSDFVSVDSNFTFEE